MQRACVRFRPLPPRRGRGVLLHSNALFKGDTLTIRGELRPPLGNVEYLFQERSHGAFARTLTLNVPVAAEKAEAIFENGVLALTLPKAEEVKLKVIKVKSK
jgi:HSP20 family protein